MLHFVRNDRQEARNDRQEACNDETEARSDMQIFASVSDMQRVAESAKRRFLHRLSQRRMGMDGAGDIFQAGAHF